MLKPMDIHNKEFKKAVRGYDTEEVDEFLDEIIVDFEKMQRELDLLRNQLSTYSENMTSYKERESALNNALITAQQFADNVKAEAELAAQKIISDAKEQAKAIVGSSENKLDTMQKSYDLLTEKFQEIKDNLRHYLEGQLDILSHDDFVFESSSTLLSSIAIPEIKLDSDLGTEADNEETKINMKLQEIMDAKIYDKNVKDTEYRY